MGSSRSRRLRDGVGVVAFTDDDDDDDNDDRGACVARRDGSEEEEEDDEDESVELKKSMKARTVFVFGVAVPLWRTRFAP